MFQLYPAQSHYRARNALQVPKLAWSIWPRPCQLGLEKMCYPMQNTIGCIQFVAVTLQVSLCNFATCLCEWRQLLWIFSYVLLALSPCVQSTWRCGLDLGLRVLASACPGVVASFNISEWILPTHYSLNCTCSTLSTENTNTLALICDWKLIDSPLSLSGVARLWGALVQQ